MPLTSHVSNFGATPMKSITRILTLSLSPVLFMLFITLSAAQTESPVQYPAYPSETPATLQPATDGFDYVRREVMIPMRDGVKLHTVILVPKGAKGAPILLTRTPYDANALTTHANSAHLGPSLSGYDNATEVIVEGGYIRAVQDVRGKYGSEGDYVMNRPLHGPQNPTPVDHATDTYDTIDWLVKNVPEGNGRVGILGISYDGFLPLMALVNPHPALKVSVPMNPMVDGWMGDDWFHNGAFRQQNMAYIYEQEASRVYKAIKPMDTNNDQVFLVMGPWHHGQEIEDASSLGALKFGSDTGLYFRREILAPFLAQYLKDGARKADVAPVTAFETGTNQWRRLTAWPAGCTTGCTIHATPLYLSAGLRLSFAAPKTNDP